MPYSLDQAKVLLQTTERTPQALLNLVRQISVEATGSITVFYGGNLPDGSNATAVIGKMVEAGEDIRVIDRTPVGKFLLSPEFLAAAGQASGLSGDDLDLFVRGELGKNPATDWIYSADINSGPWAAASKNFAAATTGEVRLFVSGSTADRALRGHERFGVTRRFGVRSCLLPLSNPTTPSSTLSSSGGSKPSNLLF